MPGLCVLSCFAAAALHRLFQMGHEITLKLVTLVVSFEIWVFSSSSFTLFALVSFVSVPDFPFSLGLYQRGQSSALRTQHECNAYFQIHSSGETLTFLIPHFFRLRLLTPPLSHSSNHPSHHFSSLPLILTLCPSRLGVIPPPPPKKKKL